MFILFILSLIGIPIILGILIIDINDGVGGFFCGFIISFLIFVVTLGATSEIKSTEELHSNFYTVETTPTRQFIYIKNKNGSAARTLEFTDVKFYNLINSGNFTINKNSWGNFIFENYKNTYEINEKED